MTATFQITHAYPDCPTCGGRVDEVKHESLDDDQRLDASYTIQSKGNPFVLQPCGHEMYGALLADDTHGARITEWRIEGQGC